MTGLGQCCCCRNSTGGERESIQLWIILFRMLVKQPSGVVIRQIVHVCLEIRGAVRAGGKLVHMLIAKSTIPSKVAVKPNTIHSFWRLVKVD